MPLTRRIIVVFAILAQKFELGIPKVINVSQTTNLSLADGQHLLGYYDEGKIAYSFSPARDLSVDLASGNFHAIDKQHLAITQSMPSTTRQNDGRKLLRADGNGKSKKPHVKIVVYDKIKGYLNWMQDWFIQAASERCSTVCSVTEDKKQVSYVLSENAS